MMLSEDERTEVLRRCLEAIEQGYLTIDQCVGRYPTMPDLRDMLNVIETAQHSLPPTMSSQRKQVLQHQLVAGMNAHRAETVRQSHRWLQRGAVLATNLLLIFLVGVGLLMASASALPGDALYGLKHTAEQVEVSFASNQTRPSVLAKLSQTRLTELAAIVQRGQAITPTIFASVISSLQQALAAQPDTDTRIGLYNQVNSTLQIMTTYQVNLTYIQAMNTALTFIGSPTPAMSATLVVTPSSTNTVSPLLDDLRGQITACVTDSALQRSLFAKVNANQFQALINEITAQSGKKIEVSCATKLIQLATTLLPISVN